MRSNNPLSSTGINLRVMEVTFFFSSDFQCMILFHFGVKTQMCHRAFVKIGTVRMKRLVVKYALEKKGNTLFQSNGNSVTTSVASPVCFVCEEEHLSTVVEEKSLSVQLHSHNL